MAPLVRAPALAGLLLLVTIIPLAVVSGQAPDAAPDAVVERAWLRPNTLPEDGGVVNVHVVVNASVPKVRIKVEAADPTGFVPDAAVTLANLVPSTARPELHTGVVQVQVPGGPVGTWLVRVTQAWATNATTTTSIDVDGGPAVPVLVARHPEAGDPWRQLGGDGARVGRTFQLGPERPTLRWSFASLDQTPLSAAVVTPTGGVLVASEGGPAQGGTVYLLDADGALQRLHQFAFPIAGSPAVAANGTIYVASKNPEHALTMFAPNLDLQRRIPLDAPPITGPVVTPGGDVFVLIEPWTLVRVDPTAPAPARAAAELTAPNLGDVTGQVLAGPPSRNAGGFVAVAASDAGEGGVQLVHLNGTAGRFLRCGCTVHSVSFDPSGAVVRGASRSLLYEGTTGSDTMRAIPGVRATNTIHTAPAQTWDRLLLYASEDGRLRAHTGSAFVWEQRVGVLPLRSSVAVDANRTAYVADCRSTLWAVAERGGVADTLWSVATADELPCGEPGPIQPLALGPNGLVLWTGVDGVLRAVGENRPPVPAFDARWQGPSLLFDAGASSDPDGSELSYAWSFGDGGAATGAVSAHTYATGGNYTVRLTVSDGISSATTSREFNVNLPPVPQVEYDLEGYELRARAGNTTDPEGDPFSMTWSLDGEDVATGPTFARTFSQPRQVILTLRLEDPTHVLYHNLTVLVPEVADWDRHQVFLFDGQCIGGLCMEPAQLEAVEGTPVQVRFINGGTRRVEIGTGGSAVAGTASAVVLSPGDQRTLHLDPREPGRIDLPVAPGPDQPSFTTFPVEVRQRPAELEFSVVDPPETLRVERSTTITVALAGTTPPSPTIVEVRAVEAGNVLGATRLALVPNGPVDETVEVEVLPTQRGDRTIEVVVVPDDPRLAVAAAAPGAATTFAVTVKGPSIGDRALAVIASPIFWAVLVAGLIAGGVYWYLRSRRRTDEGGGVVQWSTDEEPTRGGAYFPGSAGGRFNIQKPLGAGGYGRTYLATDTVLDRDVVLKEIADRADRDAILREARAGGALNHPNVVTVHDVLEDNGNAYVVLEYVDGGTLGERLNGGPLPATAALDIADGVLAGLSALHAQGVVHRDVKPSNIMLATDGSAKLTDFGLAVAAGTDLAEAIGTPRFMSPEQLRGGAATERSDIYQAAAVLYRALAGGHHLGLASGASMEDAQAALGQPVRLPADGVAPELEPVLRRALAVDPSKRFASATEMRDALARVRKALGE